MNSCLNKLELTENIITTDLDELVEADTHLYALWKSFEKDVNTGLELIGNASLAAITLPSIFGYPDTIYYYNGIIISPVVKGQVKIILEFNSLGKKRQKQCGF